MPPSSRSPPPLLQGCCSVIQLLRGLAAAASCLCARRSIRSEAQQRRETTLSRSAWSQHNHSKGSNRKRNSYARRTSKPCVEEDQFYQLRCGTVRPNRGILGPAHAANGRLPRKLAPALKTLPHELKRGAQQPPWMICFSASHVSRHTDRRCRTWSAPSHPESSLALSR